MSEEKKDVKVKWFKSQGGLSEIYQQTGMMFAFVGSPKDGNKMCHPWVKCRDFLHDAVRSQLTGKPCSIYGFNFNPSKNPKIDLNRMRMLATKGTIATDELPVFKEKIAAALKLINHFERYAKSSLSTAQEVESEGSGKRAVYLFTGPKMWVRSPFLISMYSMLIRLGDKRLDFKNAWDLRTSFEKLHNEYQSDNDSRYMKDIWDKLHPIMKNRKDLFQMKGGFHDIFFKEMQINSFHDYSGILSLAKYRTRDEVLNQKVKEMVVSKK